MSPKEREKGVSYVKKVYVAKFDENPRAVGILNPLADKNEGGMFIPGGRREDTCDRGRG